MSSPPGCVYVHFTVEYSQSPEEKNSHLKSSSIFLRLRVSLARVPAGSCQHTEGPSGGAQVFSSQLWVTASRRSFALFLNVQVGEGGENPGDKSWQVASLVIAAKTCDCIFSVYRIAYVAMQHAASHKGLTETRGVSSVLLKGVCGTWRCDFCHVHVLTVIITTQMCSEHIHIFLIKPLKFLRDRDTF